jgi:hypothetical protein
VTGTGPCNEGDSPFQYSFQGHALARRGCHRIADLLEAMTVQRDEGEWSCACAAKLGVD